jgi:hypothetical protein
MMGDVELLLLCELHEFVEAHGAPYLVSGLEIRPHVVF